MSRLFIVHRTSVDADDSQLPREPHEDFPWKKSVHRNAAAEIVYKEAGNVIEWALGHGLTLELDFMYDYLHHKCNIVVFARNVDPQTKMMLELSKPDPVPSHG